MWKQTHCCFRSQGFQVAEWWELAGDSSGPGSTEEVDSLRLAEVGSWLPGEGQAEGNCWLEGKAVGTAVDWSCRVEYGRRGCGRSQRGEGGARKRVDLWGGAKGGRVFGVGRGKQENKHVNKPLFVYFLHRQMRSVSLFCPFSLTQCSHEYLSQRLSLNSGQLHSYYQNFETFDGFCAIRTNILKSFIAILYAHPGSNLMKQWNQSSRSVGVGWMVRKKKMVRRKCWTESEVNI